MNKSFQQQLLGLAWGMLLCAIISLLCSCATRTVVVPEVRQTVVHERDTVVRTDSVVLSSTTIVREADSAMMAGFGVRIGKAERAWLVSQTRGRDATTRTAIVSRRDSIVHDTIRVPCPVEVNAGSKSSPWPLLTAIVVAVAVAALGILKKK